MAQSPIVGLAQFGNILGKSANVLGSAVGAGQVADPNLGYNSINNALGTVVAAKNNTAVNQTAPDYAATQAARAAASNAAAYNQQAQGYQDQYNTLDGQLASGQSNLNNQYNTNLNDLNDSNAIAKRNYNTSVANNTQNFLSTKNGINTTVRNNANSLQRLLGLNGAGNSSAATEAAPYAAALQGSQALNGAQTTYAQNQSGIDTNWQDTQNAYKKQLTALDQNKYASQQSLQAQIAQQRMNLLNQITNAKTAAGDTSGNGARAQQVKDLLSQIAGYSNQYANPVPVDTNVSFNAPTATDYSLGRQAVASNGQSGAEGNIASPFLSLLSNRKDQYGLAA